jgi:hypothetical protein
VLYNVSCIRDGCMIVCCIMVAVLERGVGLYVVF